MRLSEENRGHAIRLALIANGISRNDIKFKINHSYNSRASMGNRYKQKVIDKSILPLITDEALQEALDNEPETPDLPSKGKEVDEKSINEIFEILDEIPDDVSDKMPKLKARKKRKKGKKNG